MNMIEVENLTYAYVGTNDVLKGVIFQIEKGSYTTIVGHNGSGKSTIAKLLIGLIEAKAGTITVDGMKVEEKTVYEIRERIGMVFQNPDNQFSGATVADDIAF